MTGRYASLPLATVRQKTKKGSGEKVVLVSAHIHGRLKALSQITGKKINFLSNELLGPVVEREFKAVNGK